MWCLFFILFWSMHTHLNRTAQPTYVEILAVDSTNNFETKLIFILPHRLYLVWLAVWWFRFGLPTDFILKQCYSFQKWMSKVILLNSLSFLTLLFHLDWPEFDLRSFQSNLALILVCYHTCRWLKKKWTMNMLLVKECQDIKVLHTWHNICFWSRRTRHTIVNKYLYYSVTNRF